MAVHRQDGAWLRCLGQELSYCWDEHGRRRTGPGAADLEVSDHFSVGAPAGAAGHSSLTPAEFEAQFEFELVPTLVVTSKKLLRDLPLRLLPASELAPLPAGTAVDVAKRLRRGYDGRDALYVADAGCAGHGLFAARALPPRACLGEYVGLLRDDSDHATQHVEAAAAAAAGDASTGGDAYVMRYPAVGLHVSARELGGLLRFANHALAGDGANVKIAPCIVDGAWHMVALTTRAVAACEQLRFDYGGYAAAPWRSDAGRIGEPTA